MLSAVEGITDVMLCQRLHCGKRTVFIGLFIVQELTVRTSIEPGSL